MRKFSGFLFWTGLLFAIVVAVIAATDNGIPELILGLMFAAERNFLAIACSLSAVLIGVSVHIRHRKNVKLTRLRLGIFALVSVGAIALSVAALYPGFSTTDVAYVSEGAEIRATLYVPDANSPAPAIVIVPGSARFQRQFYDIYARRLAKQGFAVLLADKRGAGDSGGVFQSNNNGSFENLSLLAKDVVAGVNFLTKQPSVDPQRIGLFGLSQAGWVSTLAASETSDIQYMVMITAPSVSVGEENVWSDLRGDDEADPLTGFADANAQLLKTKPYGFDPRDLLSKLAIPSLWLFGDSDNSIPSAKSISVLNTMPNDQIDTRLYENYGHILIGKGSDSRLLDIAPESWKDINDWLEKTNQRL